MEPPAVNKPVLSDGQSVGDQAGSRICSSGVRFQFFCSPNVNSRSEHVTRCKLERVCDVMLDHNMLVENHMRIQCIF